MEQIILNQNEIVAAIVTALLYEIIAHIPIKSNTLIQLFCSISKIILNTIKGKK